MEKLIVTIEPSEGDQLFYLAVAPTEAGKPARGMVIFGLRVTCSGADATLKEIQVAFPDSSLAEKKFARDLQFTKEQPTRSIWLEPQEAIELPAVAPPIIRVRLIFEGLEPFERKLSLVRHNSPNPKGSYSFPGRAADLGPDEYFEPNARHAGGGGVQFHYDIHCLGWDPGAEKFRSTRPGTDGKKNADSIIWGKPVYAMADGVVIHAEWKFDDNPFPGARLLQRGAEYLGGELEEVALANLAPATNAEVKRRMLAAVRTQGDLKVIVFEQSDDAFTLTRLGDAKGPPCEKVAVAGLGETRAVTATQAGGAMTLTRWDILPDGSQVKAVDSVTVPGVEAVAVAALTAKRVVTATRTSTGPLTLAIWDLTTAGITHTPIAIKAAFGSPQVFELTALSPSRLVTPLRADDGTLKVIVWDLVSDPVTGAVTLVRRGDAAAAGAITLVAATRTSVDNQLATAVRKVSGECELAYWDIDDNGAISKTASTSTDAVSLVGICMFKRKTLATAVRTAAGNLQVDVWYLDPDSKKIIHKAAHDAGPIDRLALANVPSLSDTAATLVRTGGHLKLILWRLTGQNGLAILHGNELVGYYHMQKDSLNPALRVPGSVVKLGQLLGKAGNSGAADGPHLHISASRVDPALTPQEVMKQRASGQLVDVVRPLPFHGAKAMIAANLKKGGAEKNPLSTLDSQGVYFDRYAILPD
ncbi:MAG TPA: M23 family metallopeptidase [Pseudomonadota bacterium]|nr:M23 family metallopeptidase [Pseudomonadota bacterium]